LKLFANQFIIAYSEFPIMQEVSVHVMNERGFFPKVIHQTMKKTEVTDSFLEQD